VQAERGGEVEQRGRPGDGAPGEDPHPRALLVRSAPAWVSSPIPVQSTNETRRRSTSTIAGRRPSPASSAAA
jgi:hypothetical protein